MKAPSALALVVVLALGAAPRPVAAEPAGKNVGPSGGAAPEAATPRVPRVTLTDIFTSGDVPKPIPDNDPNGVTSILDVELPTGIPGRITDVNLILDSLPHTCVADVHLDLTSPTGTTIPVLLSFSENGLFSGLGCPDDFTGTVLDDQAPTNLATGAAPFTGAFNVSHATVGPTPLAGFRGEEATGTWTLAVSDRANGDTGSLDGWSLQITLDTLDSFACFKAKDLKQPKFTAVNDLPLVSDLQMGSVDVKKPSFVCLPADKDGTGVSDRNAAQCCYQTQGAALKPARSARVTDDFGSLELGLSKPSMLCQPCSVLMPMSR